MLGGGCRRGLGCLLGTPRCGGMWGLPRDEWEWKGDDTTTMAAGREGGGISCNSPWIKVRGPRGWRGSVSKGSEVGLTSLLTELTQVRELRPLPARCSIMVIADFNHSPGLLSEPGGEAGRGTEQWLQQRFQIY